MTRPLGVGVVGLSSAGGWAAATHVPALALADGAELRCLTGSTPESSEVSARAFGVRAHADVAHLVSDPDVDVVVVAVKTPDHASPVKEALRAGKPVYCEWPLGRSVEEAEELAALSIEVGVPLLVGLQGRSSPVLRRVRELVAEGFIGETLMVTVDAAGLMGGPSLPARSRYQLDPANGATVLTIPVGHLLDSVQFVLGPVSDLRGHTGVGHPEVEIRETGELVPTSSASHVALVGRLGRRGLLSLSCHGGSGPPPGLVWQIRGSEGALTILGDLGHPQMAELEVRGAHGTESARLLVDPAGERHAVQCLTAVYDALPGVISGAATTIPDAREAVELLQQLDQLVR